MYAGTHHRKTVSVEDSLDCPLTELGLVYEESMGDLYAFSRGPKDSLPDAVVFYAIWNYARQKDGQRTFTFDELAYQPFSPGRVFKLDEPSLAERFERLAELTQGAWQLTETAGYRQVLVREEVDPEALLSHYYARRLGRSRNE